MFLDLVGKSTNVFADPNIREPNYKGKRKHRKQVGFRRHVDIS